MKEIAKNNKRKTNKDGKVQGEQKLYRKDES